MKSELDGFARAINASLEMLTGINKKNDTILQTIDNDGEARNTFVVRRPNHFALPKTK